MNKRRRRKENVRKCDYLPSVSFFLIVVAVGGYPRLSQQNSPTVKDDFLLIKKMSAEFQFHYRRAIQKEFNQGFNDSIQTEDARGFAGILLIDSLGTNRDFSNIGDISFSHQKLSNADSLCNLTVQIGFFEIYCFTLGFNCGCFQILHDSYLTL